MKVKKLISMLEKMDQDRIVIMSKDGEGNSYSPLSAVEATIYRPDSTWSGEIVSDSDEDYEEQDKDQKAVVLWPVN